MKFQRRFAITTALLACLFASTRTTVAQSSDQSLPTPVLTNELTGQIPPLDLGDPRLTRHFYAFQGVPGDLIVNLTSKNLNGDIDIFTAITFKPVLQIAMYASSASPQVTKSFYLRNRQVLILRVEARTPNDDVGTYQIRFSGAYEPFSGGIPVAENAEQSSENTPPNVRRANRLSSVGARIERPSAEASPTPVEITSRTESPAEKTPKEPVSVNESPPAKPNSARGTTRRRAPRSTRTKPAGTKEPAKTSRTATEAQPAKKETSVEGEEKATVVSREKPVTAEKPATQEAVTPQPGARLIIEEKDGTKIDRPMATVRRVVIESGVIVIVLKSGRIERVPMSAVARMSIEP